VFLCPDAALAAVPWAALPGRTRGSVLLDEYEIVHLAVAQDLLPRHSSEEGRGLLAVGEVDYERALSTGNEQGAPAAWSMKFPPLPGTGSEIETVSARFRAARPDEPFALLRESAATEAALRASIPGQSIVHLATHGYVRRDLPGLGAVKAHRPSDVRLLAGYDPMALSGLALAGANLGHGGGDDDGLLTAIEASWLDLSSGPLVVLSACDTARGDVYGGEGVLGLVRGFRAAGARAVVASLWPVDDRATSELMDRFYHHLLERGLPPASALREAALALRDLEVRTLAPQASLTTGRRVAVTTRPFAAPRHWTAFVVYGANAR
jgi:CHAT domain-containing protein